MKTILLAAATFLIASPVSLALAQSAPETRPSTTMSKDGGPAAVEAQPNGDAVVVTGRSSAMTPRKDPMGSQTGTGSMTRAQGTSKSQGQ